MGQLRQEEQLRPRDLAFGRAETIFTRLDRRRRAKPKSKKFVQKHLTEREERRTSEVLGNENNKSLNLESAIFKLSRCRYTPKARRVSLAFYYFFIYSLLINHQRIIVKRQFRKKSWAILVLWLEAYSGKLDLARDHFFLSSNHFLRHLSQSKATRQDQQKAQLHRSTEMAERALDDSLWNRVRNLTSLLLQKKK